jgi:hypothetical protein
MRLWSLPFLIFFLKIPALAAALVPTGPGDVGSVGNVASSTLQDCRNLFGQFHCVNKEDSVDLDVVQISDTEFSLHMEGETRRFTLGVLRPSGYDDSVDSTACMPGEGLIIKNHFRKIQQTMAFAPASSGIRYRLSRPDGSFVLSCTTRATVSRSRSDSPTSP